MRTSRFLDRRVLLVIPPQHRALNFKNSPPFQAPPAAQDSGQQAVADAMRAEVENSMTDVFLGFGGSSRQVRTHVGCFGCRVWL